MFMQKNHIKQDWKDLYNCVIKQQYVLWKELKYAISYMTQFVTVFLLSIENEAYTRFLNVRGVFMGINY